MCGIVGFIGSPRIAAGDILRQMTRRLVHRGPDDEGYFAATSRDGESVVGLGHRRLSIIDLQGGHQPMANETGDVWFVFNGEIYNFRALREELEGAGHRFASDSDSEVIVHAYEEWGDGCVERLRGMFAFAVWDGRRERLLVVRDRVGIKPLFLAERDGSLLFASEIKALLAHPMVATEVDRDAVYRYLQYRYVPGPATLIRGIRKLPPGCRLVWQGGRTRIERYWRAPDGDGRSATAIAGGDLAAEFRARLDEAVRIRMVSDVPFGAFLSGGIDSSAIVALMTRHSDGPVRTFSVGFDEAAYSELPYARLVSQRFTTDHHELVVRADEILDHLTALIAFRDAPVSEPSDIPFYLLSRAAARHVKMVLTGEGSDEVLAGYPKHAVEPIAGVWQRLPGVVRRGAVAPLVAALPYRFRRVKTAMAALDLARPEERYPRWFGALSPADHAALVALPAPEVPVDDMPFQVAAGNTPLRRILYFDQTSWLPDNLLERADRMTMAASIEARVPFLDHELMAWLSTLPDRHRLRGRQQKVLLRAAMDDLLPAEVLGRRKVGFRVPINLWFQTTLRDFLADALTSSDSLTRDYYHRPQLQRLVAEHTTGRQNHEKLLWTLLNLELWHRIYLGGDGSLPAR